MSQRKQIAKRRHDGPSKSAQNNNGANNARGLAAPAFSVSSDGPQSGIAGSVGKGGVNNSDDVRKIQQFLLISGADIAVDGQCGPKTIAAINAFQKNTFGWSDGKVDVGGQSFTELQRGGSLSGAVGDNGQNDPSEVMTIQRLLNSNGANLTVDGKMGSKTIGAIKSYQFETFGWSDGKVDPNGKTWSSLMGAGAQTEGPGTTGSGHEGATGDNLAGTIYAEKVDDSFVNKVKQISSELGINHNYLMAAMAFESGGTFSPSIRNAAGSGATGLIQFMPSTARDLGTSTGDLAKMSAVEQLNYVKKYFQRYAGRISTLEDVYMAILWPRAIGKPNSYVLWNKNDRPKTYAQNSGLDTNKNGAITKGEAAGKVRERYDTGVAALPKEAVNVAGSVQDEPERSGHVTGGQQENVADHTPTSAGSEPSTSNFSMREFNCNDGTPVPRDYYGHVQELMENLEVLRDECGGASITVNSGYRSKSHNNKVGGASNSQHLLAKASDIRVAGLKPSQVHRKIGELIREGKMKQGGLGRYNTFTHYDIRGTAARWG